MKITNINRDRSVDFTIPSKSGGKPSVESLRAGESRNIDISEDDPQVQAYLQTLQIRTGSGSAKSAPAPATKSAAS